MLREAEPFAAQGPDKPFLDVWFEDENKGFVVGAFNLISAPRTAAGAGRRGSTASTTPRPITSMRSGPRRARCSSSASRASCSSSTARRSASRGSRCPTRARCSAWSALHRRWWCRIARQRLPQHGRRRELQKTDTGVELGPCSRRSARRRLLRAGESSRRVAAGRRRRHEFAQDRTRCAHACLRRGRCRRRPRRHRRSARPAPRMLK